MGEPTWAGAVNRNSGSRQRSKPEAKLGHGFSRSATFPQGLRAGVGAGDVGKTSAGIACDSHTEPSAAAGIDYSQVKGWPGALRTTVTQNLICALMSVWLSVNSSDVSQDRTPTSYANRNAIIHVCQNGPLTGPQGEGF